MERTNKDKIELAAIDLEFARLICRMAGESVNSRSPLFAAAAIASHAVQDSNTCCELRNYAGRKFSDNATELQLPELAEWLACLEKADRKIIGKPEASQAAPLILDTSDPGCPRLYLNRFFQYERQVAQEIMSRRKKRTLDLAGKKLSDISSRFKNGTEKLDYQQLAAYTAARNRFAIISGGPGTGKTTVAAIVLALRLLENPDLKIALCAPTGKAQALLKKNIQKEAAETLRCDDRIKEKLEKFTNISCSTIHSLLKPKYTGTQFKYNAKNRLNIDLLLVDEVSMVPLSVMAKLLSALKPEADVVLLGDKDQLSSVEAGSVLADLFEMGGSNTLPPDLAEDFRRQTGWSVEPADERPFSGCIAELTVNHRAAGPNIKEVSSDIRRMKKSTDEIAKDICERRDGDFLACHLPKNMKKALRDIINTPCISIGKDGKKVPLSQLPALAAEGGMNALLQAFRIIENFKILCALNTGRQGVEELNKMIWDILKEQLNEQQQAELLGTPIMITRNQPALELYNGDIGLIWKMKDSGDPRVYFSNPEKPDAPRSFSLAELSGGGWADRSDRPDGNMLFPGGLGYDRVFAMTIHKSQGSGFQNVLIILPEHDTPVLTRELLYTAITRAIERMILWGEESIIKKALDIKTVRQSGLPARIRESGRKQNHEMI